MSVSITLATMRRILGQLRHDHRTIGLMVGVPSLLMILLRSSTGPAPSTGSARCCSGCSPS
jgi:hypothetical protein